MNSFGIKNNRFQQKAQMKKQEPQQQANLAQAQNDIWGDDDSLTVSTPQTPSQAVQVPVFEPARLINDIQQKPQ